MPAVVCIPEDKARDYKRKWQQIHESGAFQADFAATGGGAGPAHAAAGPRRYNAAMHDIPNRIADDLLEIEATLRRQGRRGRVRPPARSGIFDTAGQCLRRNDPPTGALLACIPRFDQLIAIHSVPCRH